MYGRWKSEKRITIKRLKRIIDAVKGFCVNIQVYGNLYESPGMYPTEFKGMTITTAVTSSRFITLSLSQDGMALEVTDYDGYPAWMDEILSRNGFSYHWK